MPFDLMMKGQKMTHKYLLSVVGVVVMVGCITALSATQGGAKEQRLTASQLPDAVKMAINQNCPNCTIAKATREIENGVTIYDIEFKSGQGEMDVAEDGTVIDRETVVQTKDTPTPALEAIRKGAAGGKITQIAKDEIRAELKDGNVIRLATPKYMYEADLIKGNRVAEIQVSPEGQVTEPPKWRAKGMKEN
jgi:hypothetical protein